MPSRIDALRQQIALLERELENDLQEARDRWRYRLEAGRIRFDREARLAQARLKQHIPRFLRESSPLNILNGADHLLADRAGRVPRPLGQRLPAALLSDLWHRAREALALYRL